jgi:hypothetical protein
MKEDKLQQLIDEVETQAASIKYDFEISQLFAGLLEKHSADITDTQKKQLQWEFLLFRLSTKNSFANDGLKTQRFVPMATYIDGSVFPDPDTFPEAAFVYFESRAKQAKSSMLKARYLDFLWEKSKVKQKHLYAQEAVPLYLLNADAYQEEAIGERLDGLQRAAELCLVLESKSEKQPLIKSVVKKLNEQIENLISSKEYRWLIEMFEVALAFPKLYSVTEIKRFAVICGEAAQYYQLQKNAHLQRAFLSLMHKFKKQTPGMEESQKDFDEEIGQTHLDEANAATESGLSRVHHLQEAIKYYSRTGNKTKVTELVSEVKMATTQALEGNEFQKFSSTVEMKKEDVEKMKESLGDGSEVPEKMATTITFIPNWFHATELTEELSKKFVLQHLLPVVHYGEEYPLLAPKTEAEVQEDRVMRNYTLEARLKSNWLTTLLLELKQEKKLHFRDFKKYFKKLQDIDPETYETVLDGVKDYFKGDYFNAAQTLTLQLEDFLRKLLALLGGQTTVPDSGAFREKTLGSVLLELKPQITDLLYYYISWVMEDYRGFNLRNNIAHGFFKKKFGHPIYATVVLHIFCLLLAHTHVVVHEQKAKDEN